MSIKTPTTIADERQFVQSVETYQCANDACEASIPRTHVVSQIDMQTGTRTVRAICPHCDRMYRATFRLQGGQWVMLGRIEVVTDAGLRRGMKARVDHLVGQMQAMSA